MKKRGGMFAVGVLVLAAALAIWLQQKESSTRFDSTYSSPESATAKDPGSVSAAARNPSQSGAAAVMGVPETIRSEKEFQKWLSDEAREMDKAHIDGEAKQRELKKAVAKMTPTQTRQLMLTARNPKAPAGEKILSTYLLVESGVMGRAQLAELIQAPLADKGPHPPHSEGEMKGIRDKSLRIMGIDGLVAQAKQDPAAREALARAIPGIEDPFVRSYAEDKLRQLQ